MTDHIRLSDFKLLVFDIDGTLQNSNHLLSPFTQEVLLKLHDANIPFTLATGKNLPAVKALAEKLEIRLPLILSNGCMLQCLDGKVIEKSLLPLSLTLKVITICEEGGWDLAVCMDDDIYIKKRTYNMELLMDYGSPRLIEVLDWQNAAGKLNKTHKCLVIERSDLKKVFELEAVYARELGDEVTYCHTLPGMLEVMPRGVSKLGAIHSLCRYLDITMDEVMTFGDGNNDVEMLVGAGLGVTVENGSELAKSNADLTIASNDENGPAKFISSLLDFM